jgi:hypothetical protein
MKFTLKFDPPYNIGNNKAIDEVSGEMKWFAFATMILSMAISALYGILIVDTTHIIKLRMKP